MMTLSQGMTQPLTSKFKPPKELYKAVAIAALLTASALEGAGSALQQAVKDKTIKPNQARKTMANMLKMGGKVQPLGKPSASTSATSATSAPTPASLGESEPNLDLPPGVRGTTDFLLNTASKTGKVIGDGVEMVSKKSYEVASGLLTDAIDTFLPTELLNTPYSELNPKLTRQLTKLGQTFEHLAQDPQARVAIANLARAVTDVGIDAIDAAKPQIDRLVNRIWEVADKVGSKSVKNAVNVGLAMVVTALAEVPGVGGLIVGGLEAGTIFNNLVETGSKAIEGASQIANDSMATLSTVAAAVGASDAKLIGPINQVKQVYKSATNPAAAMMAKANSAVSSKMTKLPSMPSVPSVPSVSSAAASIAQRSPGQSAGALRKAKKHAQRKTSRIERRLHKTMKRFFKH